jgi:preprotein translocase subunit SecG
MQSILVIFHLFLALGVIGLVLMQHGKGADAGAAFGSGSSGTVFGAAGSANFLSRATAVMAALFFVTSLALAWYAMQSTDRPGLMDDEPAAIEVPAAPASAVPVVPETVKPVVSESAVPQLPSAPVEAPSDSGVPAVQE